MSTKNKRKAPPSALNADVRRLLKKYHCPSQLHEVRAQFMGAIASPVDPINPTEEIRRLWRGEMPDFASLAAADEFMQVLVMDLWNQQAGHFGAFHTFTLTQDAPEPTEKALKAHAKLRFEELQAFLVGFFQGEDSLHIDPEVGDCLDVLDDLIRMFGGISRLSKEPRVVPREEILGLINQLAELTTIAQREINHIIALAAQERGGDEGAPPRLH